VTLPSTPVPFQTAAEVAAGIPRVVEHLRGGGLLAYPTETVYGLGSRAVQADVAALAALKGRVASKPFLLLISSRGMAESHGLAFNPSADALARAFWPGPLTLVLPGGSGRLPDLLRGPDGGIAVRWTSHQAIAQLVAALGAPLTSTSANLPGQPPGPGAAAIARDFAPAVEAGRLMVLDGGVLGNRPPSTVVDCTRPEAQLVREGTLSVAELRRAVGRLAP
jgi:L-threonylcarbamoyladenylate synthase